MIRTIGRWANAPDLIEPIVGYRAWRFTTSERAVQLLPVTLIADDLGDENPWEGAWSVWVRASCLARDEGTHLAPDEGCSCGFYATATPDAAAYFTAMIHGRPYADDTDVSNGVVIGRVELAGKVIEHETGYRAERARIAELIPTTTDGGVTLLVARRLELPLGPIWDTAPLVREMEEMEAGGQDGISHPGLRDRLRLRLHRRHFHLIPGGLD
jgi:hypothetical protein